MASGASSMSSIVLRRSTVPGTFAADLALALTLTLAFALGFGDGCEASAIFFLSTNVSFLLRRDRAAIRPPFSLCGDKHLSPFLQTVEEE